jgi:hypothetical protein
LTYDELVREFAAELLKAFREGAPFSVPPGEDDVTRAYRQAGSEVRDRMSPGARAAFVAFAKRCNLELD